MKRKDPVHGGIRYEPARNISSNWHDILCRRHRYPRSRHESPSYLNFRLSVWTLPLSRKRICSRSSLALVASPGKNIKPLASASGTITFPSIPLSRTSSEILYSLSLSSPDLEAPPITAPPAAPSTPPFSAVSPARCPDTIPSAKPSNDPTAAPYMAPFPAPLPIAPAWVAFSTRSTASLVVRIFQ